MVRFVTDDRAIRASVKRLGARGVGCEEFERQLLQPPRPRDAKPALPDEKQKLPSPAEREHWREIFALDDVLEEEKEAARQERRPAQGPAGADLARDDPDPPATSDVARGKGGGGRKRRRKGHASKEENDPPLPRLEHLADFYREMLSAEHPDEDVES